MQNKLIVRDIEVVYEKNGKKLKAVEGINFNVKENEFLCIIGQSGCGKTTILNAIAGFIKPKKGEILLDGLKITEPTKEIGIVFQHNALFPWKTVEENIKVGPKINYIPEYQIKKISKYYLKLIGLAKYANYYPNELSGGQQQRVGFARSLANNPLIVLMDEPFASLDAITRIKMHELLLDIYENTKKTIIFVTHNIDEAILLADRIIVLTKRPARIKKQIMVNITRPRDYEMLFANKEYIKIKENILFLIKEEIKNK